MSEWDRDPPPPEASAKKSRAKAAANKKNAKRVITPHINIASGDPDGFDKYVERLRRNDGQVVTGIGHLLNKNMSSIDRVTVVPRADDSPAYIEIRQRLKGEESSAKAYAVLFDAEVKKSDDPREDGHKIRNEFSVLAQFGLYIPTNAPALLEAQAAASRGEVPRVAVMWCEGEKSREAVERRMDQEYALEGFEGLGLSVVTSATLGGSVGVKYTNYRLRPPNDVPTEFTAHGKNDVALELQRLTHYIVLDNDKAGRLEGMALADKLENTYGVKREDIFIVEPPSDAPTGWDDADPLPPSISERQRIDMFLQAERYDGWWVIKQTRNGPEVDVDVVSNRERALRLVGISEAFVDTSTGRSHIIGPRTFANGFEPNDSELLNLAKAATEKMIPHFTVKHFNHWREPLEALAERTIRDLIYEETMAMVERGRLKMDSGNSPEQLFVKAFGLPDTPYLRQAGWHLMRDIVAMRVRPSFRGPAVIPQLLYVLVGPENDGKSTFVKVVSGGCATPSHESPRYTDSINFKDLEGSATHGDHTLHNKVAGRTAVEFADKSLGSSVGKGLADILKHFTNKGEVEYREMNKDSMKRCNLRCVRIFTTNNKEVLTEDMGDRRWVIIDTSKGIKRVPTNEKEERALRKGHNLGLDWVCENFESMLAHMYDSGAWKDQLNPTPEMLSMMKGEQGEYRSVDNWQIILEQELALRENVENLGLTPTNLSNWAVELRGGKVPGPRECGMFMRKNGWEVDNHRLPNGKQSRVWFRVTEKAKDVKAYLVWAPGAGRWQVQTEPNPDARKTMLDAATRTENDIPF